MAMNEKNVKGDGSFKGVEGAVKGNLFF